MLHRVFLPQLGQTMEEGTIERWHKQEGDTVEKGEVLYELTTDKATLEVEAFAGGTVRRILVAEGQVVPVNQLIAVIGDEEDELTEDMLEAAAPAEEAPPATVDQPEPAAVEPTARPSSGPASASPRARKIAREQKVPLEALRGSGPGGRIVERDVLDYLEKLGAARFTPAARSYAFTQGVDLLSAAHQVGGDRIRKADVVWGARLSTAPAGERITLSPMRQTIARRMTDAKQTVPHFYLVGEVAMGAAMDLARRVSEESGEKVTLTVLLVKAVGLALRQHPRMNARFDADAVVLSPACNVGVAVAVEDGLFVPVIRDADASELAAIAVELKSLAEAARAGKLIPEQYEGGSITISNMGMYGVDYFLPIINTPESCIIGVGAVRETPVVEGGEIAIARLMKVSLAVDHRVADGAEAAEFFGTLRSLLEEPEQLTE